MKKILKPIINCFFSIFSSSSLILIFRNSIIIKIFFEGILLRSSSNSFIGIFNTGKGNKCRIVEVSMIFVDPLGRVSQEDRITDVTKHTTSNVNQISLSINLVYLSK